MMLEATENTVTNKEEDVNNFYNIVVIYDYGYDGGVKDKYLYHKEAGYVRYEERTSAVIEHEKGKNLHNEWMQNLYHGIDYDGVMWGALSDYTELSNEDYELVGFYDGNGNEVELDKDGVPVKDKVSL